VVVHGVDAQADDLGVALVELALERRHVAELGGADRREVLRVREQDRPAVADPLVEIDLALGRVRGEVRSLTVYAQSHATLPIESKYSKVPFSTNPNTRGGFRVLAGAGVLAAREEEPCRGS
jgi:hypothetical protein